MNLASILNLTALVPAVPGTPTGAAPAENTPLAEFAALLGLTGQAAGTGKELPEGDGKDLPELPVELPPDLLAMPPMQMLTVERPAPAPPLAPQAPASATAFRLVPAPLKPIMPDSALLPAPAVATAPQPSQPPFEAAQAAPQMLITLPLPIQQQVKMPLPVQVQAQVQAATTLAQQPDPTSQQLATAAAAAPPPARRKAEAALPASAPMLAEHSERLPELARIAPTPVSASTPLLADPPRAATVDTIASLPAATPLTDRHDFSAIVDRLTEARELAQPGRASLQLAHRDFGPVSVQFDMAGPALKVALTSPDAGFAPAVEAALSDRPIAALGDAARTDTQEQRSDQSALPPAATSSGPAAQSDGQRPDQNARQSAPRHPFDQVRGQSPAARESEDETTARRARDGSLFA